MIKPQPAHLPILHPLLEVSPELWEGISDTFRRKKYANNDRIVSHGNAAENLWLVVSGWIKLLRHTPDGKESIVGLCTEGDVFGEAALFTGAAYPYTAEVVGSHAELVAIPALALRAVVAQDPSLSSHVMAMLNERTAQAHLKLEQLGTMSAAQRLGCFLLRLCHTQLGGSRDLHIPIEKNVLATYLGMKPETFSRSQQQLKPVGISIKGSTIAVADVRKLREFVCGSCSESGSCDIENSAN